MRQSQKRKLIITAPLSGKLVSITEVPDPIFSQKMMGDGVAVIPESGEIYAPVDGKIATIATTKHAFGFITDNNEEILIHVGLETVGLNGEPFTVYKNAGDTVKKGDLIAKVDLDLLAEKGISPITPVVICSGGNGETIEVSEKEVAGGIDPVIEMEIEEKAAPAVQDEPAAKEPKKEKKEEKKKKKKLNINFDFLQKFGKVPMPFG